MHSANSDAIFTRYFVMSPNMLHDLLDLTSHEYINSALDADSQKQCAHLPQVCELHKGDFGNYTSILLKHRVTFINIGCNSTLMELLHAE